MISDERLRARIQEIMEAKRLSQAEFAREIRESPQNVSNYLSGQTKKIPVSFLSKIIDRYPDVDPRWLLTESGQPPPEISDVERAYVPARSTFSSEVPHRRARVDDDETQVPIYKADLPVRHDPDDPGKDLEGVVIMPTRWLRQWGINPEESFIAPVVDASMEPLFEKNARVIGEHAEITQDGIYAFNYQGRLLVRQVVRTNGFTLQLKARNDLYDPIIPKEGAQLHPIGKVVGKITSV